MLPAQWFHTLLVYDGENIIKVTAVSLGKAPPNTSRIELVDSKIKYPVISQLEIGKTAIIKVIK